MSSSSGASRVNGSGSGSGVAVSSESGEPKSIVDDEMGAGGKSCVVVAVAQLRP
jgi:hypothetical protein